MMGDFSNGKTKNRVIGRPDACGSSSRRLATVSRKVIRKRLKMHLCNILDGLEEHAFTHSIVY
eukprot:scaffold528_cov165-Amphora_coffeaeformis.AAC.36